MVRGRTSSRKVFEILDLMFEEVLRYEDRLLYVFRPADQSHVLQLVPFRLNLHDNMSAFKSDRTSSHIKVSDLPATNYVSTSDSFDDSKVEIDRIDHTTRGQHIDVHSGEGLRSKWEDVDLKTTLKSFKKAIVFCICASFTSACDGYQASVFQLYHATQMLMLHLFRHQIGINGNVIANPGFIETFGNQVDPTTGAKILSAATLSAFSAMISTGQIIGMLTLPL
jgi:hypothetical protein